jgi:hypothetical protein
MDAASAATRALPDIPCDAEGPVFREPWEAQAFAMALVLHERGVFTWKEWAATLGAEIKRAQPRALPPPTCCIVTAMPGTTPPIARRMASRSC